MIRFTEHARAAMYARGIALNWAEATIHAPDRAEIDPRHPERLRSFRMIPAFGARILRAVHRRDGSETVVITMHFDGGGRR
jgi:hypothetical protein